MQAKARAKCQALQNHQTASSIDRCLQAIQNYDVLPREGQFTCSVPVEKLELGEVQRRSVAAQFVWLSGTIMTTTIFHKIN